MFPHVAVFSVSDIFFRSGTCTYKIWNTYSSAQFPNSCYSTRGPTKSQIERESFENNTTFPFSNMHVFNKCWSGRFNIYQERRLTNLSHATRAQSLLSSPIWLYNVFRQVFRRFLQPFQQFSTFLQYSVVEKSLITTQIRYL